MLMLGLARFRRGMTLGVRAAVFDEIGQVFLVRHTYVPGWYLPGGGVEPGETLAAALDRELMEEGGIALDEPARFHGFYLNLTASRRDHVAFYVSHNWQQHNPPKTPNLEIAECGFFHPQALPESASPATRRRLAEIENGTTPSQEW